MRTGKYLDLPVPFMLVPPPMINDHIPHGSIHQGPQEIRHVIFRSGSELLERGGLTVSRLLRTLEEEKRADAICTLSAQFVELWSYSYNLESSRIDSENDGFFERIYIYIFYFKDSFFLLAMLDFQRRAREWNGHFTKFTLESNRKAVVKA